MLNYRHRMRKVYDQDISKSVKDYINTSDNENFMYFSSKIRQAKD